MALTTLQLSDPDQVVAFREQGRGEPLMLIHGVGMQSAAWEPQIEALSQNWRVLAVDMPGHGGSHALPVGSLLPDYVDWLARLIKTLGLGVVNLVGHSMGALVVSGFAVLYPQLTCRVALLNGVFCRSKEARAAVEARAEAIQRGVIDVETPLQRWFKDEPEQNLIANQVRQWLEAVDPVGYGTAYAAFAQGDATYAKYYGEITCPFLALTGDGDPNSTPKMSRIMAQTAHDGRAVIIPGHRHMLNLTAPDAVNAQLCDWLNRPLGPKRIS